MGKMTILILINFSTDITINVFWGFKTNNNESIPYHFCLQKACGSKCWPSTGQLGQDTDP